LDWVDSNSLSLFINILEQRLLKMKQEIRYRDLSTPLKIVVIGGWIGVVTYALAFLYGFFSAFV
jgi:hypothetical protein